MLIGTGNKLGLRKKSRRESAFFTVNTFKILILLMVPNPPLYTRRRARVGSRSGVLLSIVHLFAQGGVFLLSIVHLFPCLVCGGDDHPAGITRIILAPALGGISLLAGPVRVGDERDELLGPDGCNLLALHGDVLRPDQRVEHRRAKRLRPVVIQRLHRNAERRLA